MALANWNISWQNMNEQRRYPLFEDASGLDISGTFRLPDSFLVGLYLAIPAGEEYDSTAFYLDSLSVFDAGYHLTVAYAGTRVAGATIIREGHFEGKSYTLAGFETGGFGDVRGHLAVGLLGEIEAGAAGHFLFDLDGARLDPDCVRPMLRGVRELTVRSGQDTYGPFRGSIELVAGSNVALTSLSDDESPDTVQIRIDAIEGAGLTDSCVCDGSPLERRPILTVNGVGSTSGDLLLLGSDCLEIAPAPGGLRMEDLCSQPCCGSAELEALRLELDHLLVEYATLRGLANRLETAVDHSTTVVLGSRLGDDACGSCPDPPPTP